MCYTLRGGVVILYATVRAAKPPAHIAVYVPCDAVPIR